MERWSRSALPSHHTRQGRSGGGRRLRGRARPLRYMAVRQFLRTRLVPESVGGVEPVPSRTMGVHSVWLDVGVLRTLGLGALPLRSLGSWSLRLALDPRCTLGSGVGLLGIRTFLDRLVPARLLQPTGLRLSFRVSLSRWSRGPTTPRHARVELRTQPTLRFTLSGNDAVGSGRHSRHFKSSAASGVWSHSR